MYLGLRVWVARHDQPAVRQRSNHAAPPTRQQTLDDPVITEDSGAAQYRQSVMATLFHKNSLLVQLF